MFPCEMAWNGASQTVTVLSVSTVDEDRVSLKRILSDGDMAPHRTLKWSVVACATPESALIFLQEKRIPIAICDCDVSPDTWKEMLEILTLFPDPPFLIVTSRLADEQLWAEALNLGAWDVLAKPFDKKEVIRTLSSAWLRWLNHHGPAGEAWRAVMEVGTA